MYTKVCRNVGYSLYTFCKHFVYINSGLQKVYIIKTMYTICIQNSYKTYTNNCMQNGFHVSTYFEPNVVHFLGNHCVQFKLETCWLSNWR